ncbi:MAG: UDP-N-acetylmuramate--L-alanine ligase, partial [Clostridia bacterium]|nr:UDP-N-acetylmuramate--L-alanine ligase [Clostridia bacterium]
MSALAMHLKRQDFYVFGSDIAKNEFVFKLQQENIKIFDHHSPENVVGADVVVYNSAIPENSPELVEAKRRNLTIIKRSELLNEVLSNYKNVIAISGTHGKTTTTAMIAEIFLKTKPITAFVGGESYSFGNFNYATSDTAITEACEFEKNLLDIHPTVSVILNLDRDHLDTYQNKEEMVETFARFSNNSIKIVNKSDSACLPLKADITFGFDTKCNFYAKNIIETKYGISFSVFKNGKSLGKIKLKLNGKHNALNALSAIAVADLYDLPLKTVKSALKDFKGVKRRNEFIGQINKCDFYADYAHHPTEISVSLNALRKKLKGKTLIIFQPHTYSRTKFLLNEFVDSLNCGLDIAIYKT